MLSGNRNTKMKKLSIGLDLVRNQQILRIHEYFTLQNVVISIVIFLLQYHRIPVKVKFLVTCTAFLRCFVKTYGFAFKLTSSSISCYDFLVSIQPMVEIMIFFIVNITSYLKQWKQEFLAELKLGLTDTDYKEFEDDCKYDDCQGLNNYCNYSYRKPHVERASDDIINLKGAKYKKLHNSCILTLNWLASELLYHIRTHATLLHRNSEWQITQYEQRVNLQTALAPLSEVKVAALLKI
uniref:Uncharacterized protein n=1 Tax=Glossina brevipalpis TaxID=37001 RepID=A0A1A9X5H6_9MUSC